MAMFPSLLMVGAVLYSIADAPVEALVVKAATAAVWLLHGNCIMVLMLWRIQGLGSAAASRITVANAAT